jgi:phenylpyruvate tautomerase PptA (4-oxalocrotonate tautomerase family)
VTTTGDQHTAHTRFTPTGQIRRPPQGYSRRRLSRHARDIRRARRRPFHGDLRARRRQFSYSANYLDIKRSDDLVLIQLTVSNTRTVEKKKALYRKIVENLTADPGLRPEDIFINLVEVLPENWSFGHGIAQYVADKS